MFFYFPVIRAEDVKPFFLCLAWIVPDVITTVVLFFCAISDHPA